MRNRIDIAGWKVREVCVGLQAVITVGPPEDPNTRAQILASGKLSLTLGGERHDLDVEGSRYDLAPLLRLYGAVAHAIVIEDDSTLVVRFEDGAVIDIPPERPYEAWELYEPGGAWISEIRDPDPR